jgi:tetratricopeptide (TPR) repeat protein
MFRPLLLALCLSAPALGGPDTNRHLERAALHEAQGRMDQATAEFAAAVAAAARGSNPAELIRTLDLACAHYQDTGQIAQSEPCLRRLLTLSQNLLGAQALPLNRIVNRLACVYIELSQPGRADRLQLPQWLARVAAEDPLSNDRIDLLGTLAAVALIRRNPAQAVAFNLDAWSLIEQRGETETPSALTSLNNLAIAYREAKRYRDAEETLLRALALANRAVSRDSLALAYTHANLAHLHNVLRRYAAAERHLAAALPIVERRYGPASPRTAALLASHAALLRRLGRREEARAAESRARAVSAFTGHSVDITDLARRR